MFVSALSVLLTALVAVRFPQIPFFSLLPVVIASVYAGMIPLNRGAWASGLLAGVLLTAFPHGVIVGVITACVPVCIALVRRYTGLHQMLITALGMVIGVVLVVWVGSGSFTFIFTRFFDLCAALVVGATLSALTYASTQRERVGPGGGTGFGLR